MPQFDLFCFSTQVFWVIVVFFSFYFFFSLIFLSQLSLVLKLRKKIKFKSTTEKTPGVFSHFVHVFL